MKSRRLLRVVSVIIVALLAVGAAAYYLGTQQPAATVHQDDSNKQPAEQPQKETTNAPTTVTKQMQIYYIATEDEGKSGEKIGCGDSLIPVKTESVTTADPLKEAMTRLLANKDQYYGESGLYNALYQSNLTYQSGRTEGDTVTVDLTGTLQQNGECDAPRIKAQLERTAIDASGATTAVITVNGRSLDDVLSLR